MSSHPNIIYPQFNSLHTESNFNLLFTLRAPFNHRQPNFDMVLATGLPGVESLHVIQHTKGEQERTE